MIPQRARQKWLLDWMRRHGSADVLNSGLVDAYVEFTGAAFTVKFVGANGCRQLGADLSAMAQLGYADRNTTGIGDGLSGMGFPRWVWSYRPGRGAALLDSEIP